MLERCRMFAGYNAWANALIYDAAASLPDAAFHADRGAAFGSLGGTLNHLLVADRVWMARLMGEPPPYDRLDAVVADSLVPLRAAREAEDRRILAYAESLTAYALESDFRWTSMTAGVVTVQPLWSVLDHFFNPQAHPRGQAHALLTAAGGEGPALDLPIFQRTAGIGRGS